MKNRKIKADKKEQVKHALAKEKFSNLCMNALLAQLAEISANGIVPFTKVTPETLQSENEVLIYDDLFEYPDENEKNRFPIVTGCTAHEDGKVSIDAYMSDMYIFGGIRMDVVMEDDKPSYIEAGLFHKDKDVLVTIHIKDGKIRVVMIDDDEDAEDEETSDET